MLLPQSIVRSQAFIGKSTWTQDNNPYFSAKIDAIRVYDYALTVTMAGSLYRLAHDPNFIPQPPGSTGTNNPTSTPFPTASPTGTTNPVPPTGRSSSTGPNDFCEYGGCMA
jgi:hypothetical protein